MCIFQLYKNYRQELILLLLVKSCLDEMKVDKASKEYKDNELNISNNLNIINKIEDLMFTIQIDTMVFADKNNEMLKEEFEEDLLDDMKEEEKDNWWEFDDNYDDWVEGNNDIYDEEDDGSYMEEDDDCTYGDDDLGYEDDIY